MPASKMTPVYLIAGEDTLKSETAQKRLIARFEKMGDLDFNSDTFKGEQATSSDIISACNTVPFASELRLVLVKDAEKLSKDDQHALAEYVADPCPSTVLTLVAAKLAKNTVLYKAVTKHFPKSIISCEPRSKRDLPELIQTMAAVYGMNINRDAAQMLVGYVGESTIRLDTELKKIATAMGGKGTITQTEIARFVAATAEIKPWDLTDAVSRRDAVRSEELLDRMRDQSPQGLLSLLTARIRILITVKALEERGTIAELPSLLGRESWKAKNYRMFATRFSSEELLSYLSAAADADKAMKSGADPMLAFETLMLSMCRPAEDSYDRRMDYA